MADVSSGSTSGGLCLASDVAAVGFDLDHTVARYHCRNLSELIHRGCAAFCAQVLSSERRSSSSESAELLLGILSKTDSKRPVEAARRLGTLPFDYEKAKRGVIVDTTKGTLVQLDEDALVVRAFHPRSMAEWSPLSDSDLDECYGVDRVSGFAGSRDSRWWPLSTHFESPAGPVFGALVCEVDAVLGNDGSVASTASAQHKKAYAACAELIFDSFGHMYSSWSDDSPYFTSICREPEKYLVDQEGLGDWLRQLAGGAPESQRSGTDKSEHPYVFLLTNSLPQYTDFLCRRMLGSEWKSYFAFTNYVAQKPRWFTGSADFHSCDIGAITSESPKFNGSSTISEAPIAAADFSLDTHATYAFGSAEKLHPLLKPFLEKTRPNAHSLPICYVGDHLRNDTTVAKRALGWQTIGVVEELLDLEAVHGCAHDVAGACHQRDRVQFSGSTNSAHSCQHDLGSTWYSYFSCGDGGHQKRSFWAREMDECDLYVPHLGRLASFGAQHKFECRHTASLGKHHHNG